jgi:hypothetical protein
VAAKFVGRWPSGAPLLAPERDDPELGADPARNNAFLYAADDARGLKCPLDAHARRTYPRDSKIVGVARFHRIIRRSSSYGPSCPVSSTPVAPAPTTTNVSQILRRRGSGSRSAISKAPKMRPRSSSASSIVFIPGAWCANSGCPNYDCSEPAARIRLS